VRIAHAQVCHVAQGGANVLGAGAALADALRHHLGATAQVELARELRVRRVGDEGEGAHPAAVRDPHRHQFRLVDAARHLPVP